MDNPTPVRRVPEGLVVSHMLWPETGELPLPEECWDCRAATPSAPWRTMADAEADSWPWVVCVREGDRLVLHRYDPMAGAPVRLLLCGATLLEKSLAMWGAP